MVRRLILVTLVSLTILAMAAGAAYPDIPGASRIAIEDAVAPHGTGGATGACSIQYYNFCRWLWAWHQFREGDEVGVIFDLPTDCAKMPGEKCMNTGFWWYWRYTYPGRNCTISYKLYNLDDQGCKLDPPIGTLAEQDPTERWNHYPSLGGPITSDHVSIIASWDNDYAPWMITDNNVHDLADPTNCPGYAPHTLAHSVTWRYGEIPRCPPEAWVDAAGPTEILMDASFECHTVATKNGSWSGVKKLFR